MIDRIIDIMSSSSEGFFGSAVIIWLFGDIFVSTFKALLSFFTEIIKMNHEERMSSNQKNRKDDSDVL